MKKIFCFAMILSLFACSTTYGVDNDQLIKRQIELGNYSEVSLIIDSIMSNRAMSDKEIMQYNFIKDSLRRAELDFNKSLDDVVGWIEKNHNFTPTEEQLIEWEDDLSLEYRVIDGTKWYFRNAAPNLFRVNKNALALSKYTAPKSDLPRDELLVEAFRNKVETDKNWHYILPLKSFKIRYTLTVKPDVVPEGESVRAWLPFPRADISRQYDVALINASQSDYVLADDNVEHNSIYMEKIATKGEPTIFSVDYKFTSQGEWFDLAKADIKPYDQANNEYIKFTAERVPHIVFTDRLKSITNSIVGDEYEPLEVVRLCYRYVATNYPWASALEYSTIKNIPEYAIKHQKGDCGQVALLLIAMLRYKGIPARWQSGWMLHPGEVNLHDWAEVYFEGVGWVPIDISFARGPQIPVEPGREFFMSGIDSYRLYINTDYSGRFYPAKQFPRSETVDFQRGEVETNNENLYFDKWNYRLEVL